MSGRARIEPVFVHGVSWDTVAHVKVLREEGELGLRAAKDVVDRLVYDGETVVVEVRAARAAQLVASLAAIPSPPVIHVSVVADLDSTA